MRTAIEEYRENILMLMNKLPEKKIVELFDFASFLTQQYSKQKKTSVDKDSLLMQQQALKKIRNSNEGTFNSKNDMDNISMFSAKNIFDGLGTDEDYKEWIDTPEI